MKMTRDSFSVWSSQLCLFLRVLAFLANTTGYAMEDLSAPPILIGQVIEVSTKTIKLRLEDGRQEIDIPARFAALDTQKIRNGAILRISITEDLLREIGSKSISPSSPSSFSDDQLIQQILNLREMVGNENVETASGSRSLEFFVKVFEISEAKAKPSDCAPISSNGNVLNVALSKTDPIYKWVSDPSHPNKKLLPKETPCTYSPFNKLTRCSSSSVTALRNLLVTGKPGPGGVGAEAINDRNTYRCNPLLYGTDSIDGTGAPLCSIINPGATQLSCNAAFATRCTLDGSSVKDCVRKFVLPYVKANSAEFANFQSTFLDLCGKGSSGKVEPIVDPVQCARKDGANLILNSIANLNEEYKKDQRRQSTIKGCNLSPKSEVNFDLNVQGGSAATFSTISIPGCAIKRVCVREIMCEVDIAGTKTVSARRFARCLPSNCASASACLRDTLVTGSGDKNDLKTKSSSF